MVPRSPPAGRRVNLWQVSSLVHLRSVSVTLLTVPTGCREDTLHRTAVTSLLMNTEEPRTSRLKQNGWDDSSGHSDHSLARMLAQMKRNVAESAESNATQPGRQRLL